MEKREKKIAIISTLYMPHLGGVEKYSQALAEKLAEKHDVSVFCLNSEDKPDIEFVNGVTIHYLPRIGLFNDRLPLALPTAIRQIQNALKKDRFDFAIVQTRLYPFSLQVSRILHHKSIPFIILDHGTGHIDYHNPITNVVWQVYEHLMAAIAVRYCQSFYAVSQAGVTWLRHFGIQAKGVIPNCISAKEVQQVALSETGIRGEHQIPEEAVLVTYAGRLIQEKGILETLHAFSALGQKNVALAVAGIGEANIITKLENTPNVFFLGKLPHQKMLELFKETQIFSFPTQYPESLPTVILEAGAFGAAVLTTDKGGICEVIRHEETGLIAVAGDLDSVRDSLQVLLDNTAERERLGANLQQLVLDQYTWEKSASLIEAML